MRCLMIAHGVHRRLIPVEFRPHIGAAFAAGPADEPRLEIGQPELTRPSIRVDRMAGAPKRFNPDAYYWGVRSHFSLCSIKALPHNFSNVLT
jgi:hypothetical protein